MRKIFDSLFILLAMSLLPSMAHASFFAAAHPDDIELFMGGAVLSDLQSGAPTIFIVLTGGDAGAGTGAVAPGYGINIYSNGYAKTRISAHVSAVRFAAGTAGTPIEATTWGTVTIAGKVVDYAKFGSVYSYHLYLPDGGFGGAGFPGTNYQSLQKLYGSQIASVDSYGSVKNSYTRADVLAVLRGILAKHGAGVSKWINLQESNTALSPNDHSDHTHASLFMQEAASSYPCYSLAKFIDYDTANRPENLSEARIRDKFAMWGALNSGLIDLGNPRTYEPGHNVWVPREYLSTLAGQGSCVF